MSKDRNIIRDKRITPFFLDYIKYNYLVYKMNPIKGMPMDEIIECQTILEASYIAHENLLFGLQELFGLDIYMQDCNHPTSQLIIKACNYYERVFGMERIIQRENKHLINLANLKVIEKFQPNILKCKNCGLDRQEVEYKNLPIELKQAFKAFKDYGAFWYCMKCNEYGLIQ